MTELETKTIIESKANLQMLYVLKEVKNQIEICPNMGLSVLILKHNLHPYTFYIMKENNIIKNDGIKVKPIWRWNTIEPNIYMADQLIKDIEKKKEQLKQKHQHQQQNNLFNQSNNEQISKDRLNRPSRIKRYHDILVEIQHCTKLGERIVLEKMAVKHHVSNNLSIVLKKMGWLVDGKFQIKTDITEYLVRQLIKRADEYQDLHNKKKKLQPQSLKGIPPPSSVDSMLTPPPEDSVFTVGNLYKRYKTPIVRDKPIFRESTPPIKKHKNKTNFTPTVEYFKVKKQTIKILTYLLGASALGYVISEIVHLFN